MSTHYLDDFDGGQIVITDGDALVTEAAFSTLAEYNTSMPTSPSPGRTWKRNQPLGSDKWWLAVASRSDDTPVGMVDITWRRIARRRIAA